MPEMFVGRVGTLMSRISLVSVSFKKLVTFCQIESKKWAHFFCLNCFKLGKTALNYFKLLESLHMPQFFEIESKQLGPLLPNLIQTW